MIDFQTLSTIGKTIRDIPRFAQIVHVLSKNGFGFVVKALKLEPYLMKGYKMARIEWSKIEELTWAERVRLSLEELGPTFVKLGQILSTRPDLVPVQLVKELEKLQDNVPEFAYEQVSQIIEEETGQKPEELFASFEKEPFAAASIGQVHKAYLKGSGEMVVVKVQRPGIQRTIKVDLELMEFLAKLAENNLAFLALQKPSAIVAEFARAIEKEVNYKTEMFQMERFRSQFEDDPAIYVPKIHKELCTERILTMEYIEGIKSSNVSLLKERGYDLDVIARRGADTLMKQIFSFGFFHGDPHPGNILILPDNVICFLDFGMMGRVSVLERQHFADFITQILGKDERRVAESVLKLTFHEENFSREELERDVADIIDEHLYKPLKDLETGKILEQIMGVLTKYGLRLKPNLFLMLKALISVDRLGNILNPDLELVRTAEPFIRKIQMDRLNPVNFMKNMFSPFMELMGLLGEIPNDLHVLIKQLKEGRVKMEFQHVGLETIKDTMESVSYRISFAIVLAALIIGYALITLARLPEHWHGIHYIGVVGFMSAGIIGFWMLLSFLRGKKL